MNTAKISISLPQKTLEILDRFSKLFDTTRSKFVSKTLQASLDLLLEDEVAESYNEIYEDASVRKEQKDWTEKMLSNSDVILKQWK